jgi:glycosyltransferase involved in cell wall biosynthesis
MGLVRVRHALDAGWPQGEGVEAQHDMLPEWTRLQRLGIRPFRPLKLWNFRGLRWYLLRGLLARRCIQEHLDGDAPPDVVHVTTSTIAFMLPRLQRRVPCVPSLDTLAMDWTNMNNGLAPGARGPFPLRAVEPFERRALETAPLSVAWTDTVARRINAVAPKAKVATLHPGVDLTEFTPRTGPREEGPVRVLFVGGRWKDKGGPDLLAALGPQLGREVVLDAVTPEQLPAQEGLAVHQATPGSSLVADLFARADIFCLPTMVDACPFVITEAMASGVPVVANDTASIAELVGAGGLIVPQRDRAELSRALQALIDDPALRARLGAEGRARVEAHYDARVNTPKLVTLLRDVAERHPAD